ncbi:MAG: hypothetical protein RR367_01110 [Clostridia bacterium]
MKHYIIVKYNDLVADREAFLREATEVFAPVIDIAGVRSVALHPAVLLGGNRYDLMILIDMERESLPAYDASQAHRLWKENFGKYIAHKVIFDHE